MHDILKAVADDNGWPFIYGRSDFQNLHEDIESVDLTHLFLDPLQISERIDDESGEILGKTYSGAFMLVRSSDIDEIDYEERYQKYIKQIIDTDVDVIRNWIKCGYNVSFESWQITEVINMFDYNLDGIIVQFQLAFNE